MKGLTEANAYVSRHAEPKAKVSIQADPSHVFHLRSDLVGVRHLNADYVVHNRLFRPPFSHKDFRVAYVVRAGGAPLAWVYRRQADQPHEKKAQRRGD